MTTLWRPISRSIALSLLLATGTAGASPLATLKQQTLKMGMLIKHPALRAAQREVRRLQRTVAHESARIAELNNRQQDLKAWTGGWGTGPARQKLLQQIVDASSDHARAEGQLRDALEKREQLIEHYKFAR